MHDPCEREPTDALSNLTVQQREAITHSAQVRGGWRNGFDGTTRESRERLLKVSRTAVFNCTWPQVCPTREAQMGSYKVAPFLVGFLWVPSPSLPTVLHMERGFLKMCRQPGEVGSLCLVPSLWRFSSPHPSNPILFLLHMLFCSMR